jgi:predicted phage tail protein|tara:strand:+ start:2842 stop:3459 length:618 start_codon:yes stop_codon:yes gene_type:complete
MLRKLKLYGELAEITGHREFDVAVNTTAQAVSFLVNNFPQLEGHMASRYYQVLLEKDDVGIDELHYPIGQSEIKFVPVVSGAGGNLGRILLGGALIAMSFGVGGLFTNPLTLGGKGFFGFASAGMGAKAAFGIGAALVLTGVSGMLFPVPKMPEFTSEQDPKLSFSFSGTQQTGRAGTPVPVVYGEIITGSVVISGGIDTEQVQV